MPQPDGEGSAGPKGEQGNLRSRRAFERLMLPYIHIGPLSIGTFGILLVIASGSGLWLLHKNFERHGVALDAATIGTSTLFFGIAGAKLWHVFEHPVALFQNPLAIVFSRTAFAWFGGFAAGVAVLMFFGLRAGTGILGMLDLAAPSAAIAYAIGRIGCLISGDGDYGIPTTLPWGMSFPNGLVPTTAQVHRERSERLAMAVGMDRTERNQSLASATFCDHCRAACPMPTLHHTHHRQRLCRIRLAQELCDQRRSCVAKAVQWRVSLKNPVTQLGGPCTEVCGDVSYVVHNLESTSWLGVALFGES